jgi:eukaryotic-like serine/threonine-protein kinase
MTPENDRRIADIFERAVDLPLAERGDFVARACGDEVAVRREVEALLALDAEAEAGAGSALWSPPAAPAGISNAPERVGPYRLIGKLGEGGMSEVFLGLRDDGEFVRRVAVKLIRREILTAETMRRFETERQILASLDHPSIAKLLDAGRTPDGMPYFIMEYIEGEPIDLYCDRHRLTVAERLEIFRQVCLAVHFAHQNLVVHRDIKPSNILVTETGQPKLLDFGIAKLLNPDLMVRGGEPTVSWARLLTPEYASPEQILGKPVTSASDVYALGVLLFKLLTGADPYRLLERPAPELEPLILAGEPDTPSAFVHRLLDTRAQAANDLAVQRGTQPQTLMRRLAGDLDAIASKALRKEPQHRYASAEQMAEDIRRYLAGGRLLASRTESRLRPGRVTAAVLAVLLLTAIGGLLLQRSRFAAMRATAEREQERVQKIVASMERVFEEAPLALADGREEAGRELIDHAARILQQDLAGDPEAQADLGMAVGRVYFRMGLLEEAASSFQAALAVRGRHFGAEHKSAAESLAALAEVEASQGNLEEAEDYHARALAIRRQVHGGESYAVTESLVGLGRVFLADGHAAIAEPLLQEALVTRQKILDPGDVRIAETLVDLGHAVGRLESPDSADLLFWQATRIQRRASREGTWELAATLVHRAAVQFRRGDRNKGNELLREASGIERRLCDDDSPDLADSLLNLAAAARRGTPWAPGMASFPPSAAGCRMSPLAAPHLAYLLRALGLGLSELGHAAEAEPLLQYAIHTRSPAAPVPPPAPASSDAAGCVPDGGFAETLKRPCCSGVIAAGTTLCRDPKDWGGSWSTCRHICGSRPLNGCVASGGVDDILQLNHCCSGASVNGSMRCLNPADDGTTWRTCVHTCA